MSGLSDEWTMWGPRRWVLCVLLATCAQVAIAFWLSAKHGPHSRVPPPDPRVRLWRPSATGESGAGPAFEQKDPTLLALVSERGFSGPAWLTISPFEYRMTNAPEPLHWLSVRTEELADDFSEYVQTNLLTEDVIAGPLAPSLTQPMLPIPVVVPATVLNLEGELADRALLPGQALPRLSEPATNNTVVQLVVDQSGRAISAALLSSGSVGPAEQLALNFAKTARFLPRAGGREARLDVGSLVFQWARVRWEAPPPMSARR